jgi:glycosyltransferase involved in cell wall biosynthesis
MWCTSFNSKSAIPEICGDGAVYFNPHDPDDIKNKIVDLYFNENLKKKMIIQGYKQASIYSWQNTCAQVKSLILEGNNYTGGKNV